MVPLGPAPLAPGDTLRLSEGGNHFMFDLARGSSVAGADSLSVTLEFARAGALPLRFPVVPYGDPAR
jgi:copper(I)-binding protein